MSDRTPAPGIGRYLPEPDPAAVTGPAFPAVPSRDEQERARKAFDLRGTAGVPRRPVAVGNASAPASPVAAPDSREEAGKDSPPPDDSPTPKPGKLFRCLQLIFVALVMVLSLIPAVGMFWAPTTETTGNQTLAKFPKVWVTQQELDALGAAESDSTEPGDSAEPAETDPADNGEPLVFNQKYLMAWGKWFEDHFAYRNQLVASNAYLRSYVFGVSATDQVVVGRDGWLFYSGTLPDYLGTEPLNDRTLANIAHNMDLLQGYAEDMGAKFTFTVAPNKNSIYAEHMPGRYIAASQPGNAERLVPYLEAAGVNYTDLFATFADNTFDAGQGQPQAPYYLLRDSHWNNRGADRGAQALAASLGMPYTPVTNWQEREDNLGDVDEMLYLYWGQPAPQWYSPGTVDKPDFSGTSWSYTATLDVDGKPATTGVEAETIRTTGPGKSSLLVYRDSFGNALVPLLSAQTSWAEYSKMEPYLGFTIGTQRPDYVIVEKVERHLGELAELPPIAPTKAVKLDTSEANTDKANRNKATIKLTPGDTYVTVSGQVDAALIDPTTAIYVSVTNAQGMERVYPAFYRSDLAAGWDNGYQLLFDLADLESGKSLITVYVEQGTALTVVGSIRY